MSTASTVCDDFPTLTGRQEPHHLSMAEGDFDLSDKAIELARRAGATAMPWQKLLQRGIMAVAPDGMWTHPDCCLIIPRQNGKSEILIHRCLYGLFKLTETILYTAQRWKTARDAWRRMRAIIKGRMWLEKLVVKATCSQGEGIIELSTGAIISFGTRSNDTGRGLTVVDLIVYDEAYNLTDGELSAMSFTQMASRNPQTIYASSAVNQDDHPNGSVLSSVRRRGLKREIGLLFAEWMAPADMPRDLEETWKYANPSYGVIQTAAKILKIMKNLSTPAGRKGFDVEALGRGDWPRDEEDVAAIIGVEVFRSMTNLTPNLMGPIALALHRSLDGSAWALAAAQRTNESKIHIEIGYLKGATHAEMVSLIVKVVAAWDPVAVVIDRKSPANVLEPLLVDEGIEPEMTGAPQMASACQGFLDDALSGQLSHTAQEILVESVAGATKRIMPQGDFAWSSDAGPSSVPLITATLARWALLTFGAEMPPPASPATGADTAAAGQYSPDELDVLTAAF